MKKESSFDGEYPYYHVFNRGVEKRDIFLNDSEYKRFLFLLFILQGDTFFNHVSRLATAFGQHSMLAIEDIKNEITRARIVELVAFVLMPNHFHLILRELESGGVSKFMQRLGNSYTKYFNIKHDLKGHLFGSRFHSRLIDTNEYLLHLSSYIHRNPRELPAWKNKEHLYPGSSFQDYIKENRWGSFLNQAIILDQFQNPQEYWDFVKTSTAKLSDEALAEMVNIEC